MRRFIVLAACALLAGCGGGEEEQGELTASEKALLAEQIVRALDGFAATQGTSARSPVYAVKQPVDFRTNCAAGGYVRGTGNVFVSCPDPPAGGACTTSGAVTFNFGDRTNNLEDCGVGSGLFVDGSLYMGLTGQDQSAKVTLTGGLETARKGPSGGLVPFGMPCWVNLEALSPQRTVTGSVCGFAVNRTF
jgi:hypothetical protein